MQPQRTVRRSASPARSPRLGTRRGSRGQAHLYRLLVPRIRCHGLRHLHDADAAADLAQRVVPSPWSVCAWV